MIAEIGLGLSIVSAGLWSGLLLTVTTILHPLYATQDSDSRRTCAASCRSPGGLRPTTSSCARWSSLPSSLSSV